LGRRAARCGGDEEEEEQEEQEEKDTQDGESVKSKGRWRGRRQAAIVLVTMEGLAGHLRAAAAAAAVVGAETRA